MALSARLLRAAAEWRSLRPLLPLTWLGALDSYSAAACVLRKQ